MGIDDYSLSLSLLSIALAVVCRLSTLDILHFFLTDLYSFLFRVKK